MALIKCTECGKEVSDKAAVCPNCGFPISEMQKENIQTFDDVFKANAIMGAISPGAIKKARSIITKNENVFFASVLNVSTSPVSGKLGGSFTTKGKTSGVFVVTDKRVLFVNSVMGIGDSKQIAIENIESVDHKNSLMNCPVRIKGITEMFVVDCNKETQGKILSALNRIL